MAKRLGQMSTREKAALYRNHPKHYRLLMSQAKQEESAAQKVQKDLESQPRTPQK